MYPRLLLIIALTGAHLLLSTGRADWINLSGAETSPNIAEIYVMDDHVRVVLEVYVDNLKVFEDLVPDDWFNQPDVDRPDEASRMRHFSAQVFQVAKADGERLQGKLELVEPRQRVDRKSSFAGMINPFTRQRVPEPPADKRVLYAEIRYPFEARPRGLTIIPPLDEEGRALASIGFIAYHKSVPVTDFRYLGAPATLNLDWDDPWYSKFDNPNLKRHHKSALMSFLYVEPYEVRHEILVRVRDLEAWMETDLRDGRYIEVDELDPLRQRIGDFLLTRNPLRVDGEALKPILDRSSYVRVALTGIQLIEKPERLETSTAIVGVIITYLTDGMPQEVTVDWDLFTGQIQRVPATATDPAGPLPTFLTPDDNVHQWHNFLRNYRLPTVQEVQVAGSLGEISIPWLTLACGVLLVPLSVYGIRRRRQGHPALMPLAGALALLVAGVIAWPMAGISVARPAAIAGELHPEKARELLQVLLKNVYRAFDFRDEDVVYDKLATSVSGDLLTDIYLQNRRSFSIQKAGGAQAKIDAVEVDSAVADRLDDGGLAYAISGRWAAQGSVGHWGHVHTRRNHYDAIVTVAATDGTWKITDLEVLEETRVDPAFRSPGQVVPAQAPGAP